MTRNVLIAMGLAAALALTACGKKEAPAEAPAAEQAAPAPEAAAPAAEQQAADAAAAAQSCT
ncbi:MAG: hypothetical protein ACREVL_07330, partial [Solimonas sp.]